MILAEADYALAVMGLGVIALYEKKYDFCIKNFS